MKVKLAELRYELAEATSEPGNSGNGDTTLDAAETTGSTGLDGGQSSQANEMRPAQASEDPQQRREDLRMRISHWETLIGFIDTSLGDLVKMRAKIADGTLDKIAFDDLWHLFRPGDLVLSKSQGHQQLFKVHFVSGGQVRRRNLTAEEENAQAHGRHDNEGPGTWSPLKLDAFSMNFDGIQMGPEDGSLTIKHYTGKKSITDLSAFPVRFHPQKDMVLAGLEERGRKFMSSAGHRFYEGLTPSFPRARIVDGLTDKAEDITSEVFVDFEAFFQEFGDLEPAIGVLVQMKQDATATSEFVGDHPQPFRHCGDLVDTKLAEFFRVHNRAFIEAFDYAEEPERMTVEHFQLLPHCVPAYCFRYRQWCK
jgi:hypothetical protein